MTREKPYSRSIGFMNNYIIHIFSIHLFTYPILDITITDQKGCSFKLGIKRLYNTTLRFLLYWKNSLILIKDSYKFIDFKKCRTNTYFKLIHHITIFTVSVGIFFIQITIKITEFCV